jgi:hypothetical protein
MSLALTSVYAWASITIDSCLFLGAAVNVPPETGDAVPPDGPVPGAISGAAAPSPGWAPEACTLPTAERPLRAADFDAAFAAAVRGLDRAGPTRLRLELEPTPQAAARMAELAVAETGCCSFFTFALTATGGALSLDVTVPERYAPVLAALADRASAAAALAP